MEKTQEHTLTLCNPQLQVTIARPGHVYTGSRFDWTGFILQVTLENEHTFCTQESLHTSEGTGGIGLCNEFGIQHALGYEEAQLHEPFMKIGVGLLRKPDEAAYTFHKPYSVQPAIVHVESTAHQVTFRSLPLEIKGYAVAYNKTISLRDNYIEITYELDNVGQKPIQTNEYNHNFISIDHCPIGPAYCLTFPIKKFSESLPDPLSLYGNEITWTRTPESDFYFKVPGSRLPETYSWQLIHREQAVGMREYSDFPIEHFALWGKAHVVSPEVFYAIELQPGESRTWKRTYEFFKM